MPPSPAVVMILSWQNENAAASPSDPTGRPLYIAPCACAQSSTTFKPRSRARSRMGSISQGQPARCTATMALVAGVQTARIVSALTFPELPSTSAQTGRAPSATAQLAEAINVRLAVMTSSEFHADCAQRQLQGHGAIGYGHRILATG